MRLELFCAIGTVARVLQIRPKYYGPWVDARTEGRSSFMTVPRPHRPLP